MFIEQKKSCGEDAGCKITLIYSINVLSFKKWPVTSLLDKSNSLVLGLSCLFILLFFLDLELFSVPITRMANTRKSWDS